MAGSFGYAAPEVMLKQGHGKAVDMWSLGVITYTLLCGYSPFRSENIPDLIDECRTGRIIFHERYWKDVSKDAKDFILTLLVVDPRKRITSTAALKHIWLTGQNATEHNLIPEIRAYIAKAKLRRGIELVKLANRIASLKILDSEEPGSPAAEDIPSDAQFSIATALQNQKKQGFPDGPGFSSDNIDGAGETPGRRMSRTLKGAIFREVVLAKVREMKQQKQSEKVIAEVTQAHERRKSVNPPPR